MRRDLLVPLSILIGSGLIAAGVYLGLQARPAPPAPAPAPGPARDAQRQAEAALAAWRERMLEACWRPALQQAPEPASSSYSLDVSFDAEGRQAAAGLSELRGVPSRPDVARCLRAQPPALRIDPPGHPVRLQLDLRLP